MTLKNSNRFSSVLDSVDKTLLSKMTSLIIAIFHIFVLSVVFAYPDGAPEESYRSVENSNTNVKPG